MVDKLRKKIVVPKHLPINMDSETYIDNAVKKIKHDMRKGISMKEAIYRINKNVVGVDNSRQSSGLSMSINKKMVGLFIIIAMIMTSVVMTTYMLYGKKSTVASNITEIMNIDGISSDQMILAAGVDTRPEIDEGAGNAHDVPGSRTDTIALFYLPANASKAAIVNIPRDLSVNIDDCKVWDSNTRKYSNETFTRTDVKINSSYADGGPECLLQTVNNTFNLNVDKYAEVDFQVFKELVDSVGGVKITTEEAMIDDTLGVITPGSGEYTLYGDKALDFVRARKVHGTSKSDLDRIQRQQYFFKTLFNTMLQTGKAKDPLFLLEISRILSGRMNTVNLSLNNISSLMKTASEVDPNNMYMTTVPIAGENNAGNLVHDSYKTEEMFDIIKSNTERINPDGAQGDYFPASNIENTSVTLVTSNKYDDRVNTTKEALESLFKEVLNTTSSGTVSNTTVYVNSKKGQDAVLAASMFPGAIISMQDAPIKTHTTFVMVFAGDTLDIISNINKNITKESHFVPQDFVGNGRDLVPRSLKNIE